MMPLQRAREAESRVGNKLSNGPPRVQSNAWPCKVFCNVEAYVSCRGYDSILLRAWLYAMNQGGTANGVLFVLDRRRISFCQGRFFVGNTLPCLVKRVRFGGF